jgi:hypothetical protein
VAASMNLGIMQPYFFPYIGHFALIAMTDKWVVFDESQYTPKTWMNRNRVLHPVNGWNWISVPLSNSSIHVKIKEVRVQNLTDAKLSALGKLTHYKKKAPFYDEVINVVSQGFDLSNNENSLVKLNINSLDSVCRYLEIPFDYQICSDLKIDFPENLAPGDWALEICKSLDIKEYLNPIGGRNLFDIKKYNANSIQIQFLDIEPLVYEPKGFGFIENLSILELMMWVSPVDIKKHILMNARVHS